jgi:hypothetical protein
MELEMEPEMELVKKIPVACATADVVLAVHLVQIVEVDVISTVDTVWVVWTSS